MADEQRLHDLLDLVEQARREGDKDTEAKAVAAYRTASGAAQPESEWSLANIASNIVRPIAKGVAALPLMAMDAGVGARNVLTGSNYQMPSDMFNESLDAYTRKPTSGLGQAAENVSSAIVGGALPAPTSGISVPQNFQKAVLTPRDLALQAGRQQGYVVPPATVSDSAGAKLLEGASGKIATAQQASVKNQAVTNRLASEALGLPADRPISTGALRELRTAASKAYETVRGFGTVQFDDQLGKDLAAIEQKSQGASKSFPGLKQDDVENVVASLRVPQFESDAAVDAIRVLREKADDAFSAGQKSSGSAYKAAANALESALDRHVSASGDSGAIAAFRDARKLIAKSYTVEKALNDSTGDVSATVLAKQLQKGKPLDGGLATAARMGEAFPKATRTFNESFPGVSPIDAYGAGGMSAMTHQPWYLAYPLVRMGARNALLSDPVQNALIGSQQGVSPRVVNAFLAGSGR